MHYYQFNIGDYKSHTEHLEPMEDLAFRRMMDWCYLHEKPLPLDIKEIERLIRMRTHSESITYVLKTYFERTADGYANYRIMHEIEKYQEKSNKAKKSAQARWNKKPNKQADLSDANALRSESEGNAKHKTLNTKQETIVKELDQQKADPAFINKAFDFFWEHYGRKVGKEAAVKKFKSLMSRKTKDQVKELTEHIVSRRIELLEKHRENPDQMKGFDLLHAATYLHNKRWEDEL